MSNLNEGQVINDRRILGYSVTGNPSAATPILSFDETKKQFEFIAPSPSPEPGPGPSPAPSSLPVLSYQSKTLLVDQIIKSNSNQDLLGMSMTLSNNSRNSLFICSFINDQPLTTMGQRQINLMLDDNTILDYWSVYGPISRVKAMISTILPNNGQTIKINVSAVLSDVIIFSDFSQMKLKELL